LALFTKISIERKPIFLLTECDSFSSNAPLIMDRHLSFFSSSLCTPSPTKINDELSTHLLTTLANCEGKNAIGYIAWGWGLMGLSPFIIFSEVLSRHQDKTVVN
jgi:hypothetical protein